jgi:hypothetical protein
MEVVARAMQRFNGQIGPRPHALPHEFDVERTLQYVHSQRYELTRLIRTFTAAVEGPAAAPPPIDRSDAAAAGRVATPNGTGTAAVPNGTAQASASGAIANGVGAGAIASNGHGHGHGHGRGGGASACQSCACAPGASPMHEDCPCAVCCNFLDAGND